MAQEIRVPTLGESIVEATVGKWLKKVGDPVAAGEPLVELETDKVNLEVMSEQAGVLGRIDKDEGADVKIGEVLGSVEAAGTAPTNGQPPATNDQPAAAVAATNDQRPTTNDQPTAAATNDQRPMTNDQPAAAATNDQRPMTNDQPPPPDGNSAARAATPVAQRMAQANNVDLSGVQGSGPSGRVVKNDVAAKMGGGQETGDRGQGAATPAAAQPPVAAPQSPISNLQSLFAQPQREQRVKMTRRRQTIARRLVEAQHTAAMLTTFNEVDMTAVMELRKRRNEAFQKRHGVKLGFMSFFVKATIGALKAFPRLNAELQGDEMLLKHYYDIGIAVGAEEGLVVPVVREADRKGFAEIEREIGELGKKARDGTLGLADLQGGTFTITNGGIFGSLMSTPILNAPQVGILGMHGIKERPIAVDGQVVVRPMMYLALSYDHRIVDGSEAVRFLVRVKELVEDPEGLLVDA